MSTDSERIQELEARLGVLEEKLGQKADAMDFYTRKIMEAARAYALMATFGIEETPNGRVQHPFSDQEQYAEYIGKTVLRLAKEMVSTLACVA